MLSSRVSIPELSLLCSLAESINSKKKIILISKNCDIKNSSLYSSAESKFLNFGFYAL